MGDMTVSWLGRGKRRLGIHLVSATLSATQSLNQWVFQTSLGSCHSCNYPEAVPIKISVTETSAFCSLATSAFCVRGAPDLNRNRAPWTASWTLRYSNRALTGISLRLKCPGRPLHWQKWSVSMSTWTKEAISWLSIAIPATEELSGG